ncbi:MAG: hypothetical protein ACHQAY_13145 [Hyphomicrobiales bacterium]
MVTVFVEKAGREGIKMLSGEGAIAIWNGIADEGRDEFYSWHLREHMPERVGISGFVRGRRYRAADGDSQPEFFTLYETVSFEVTRGTDYLNRLNAPTTWTRRATAHFRNTTRSLTRVVTTLGVGPGGSLLTLRFDVPDGQADEEQAKLTRELLEIERMPMVTGSHLLRGDETASAARTAETKDRRDIEQPARWIVLIEACTIDALDRPFAALMRNFEPTDVIAGRYVIEHTRLKTASAAG